MVSSPAVWKRLSSRACTPWIERRRGRSDLLPWRVTQSVVLARRKLKLVGDGSSSCDSQSSSPTIFNPACCLASFSNQTRTPAGTPKPARSSDPINARVRTLCTNCWSSFVMMVLAMGFPLPCSQHTWRTRACTSCFAFNSWDGAPAESHCPVTSFPGSVAYFPSVLVSAVFTARNCTLASCMPITKSTFATTFAKVMMKLASTPSPWSSPFAAWKPSGDMSHRIGKGVQVITRNTKRCLSGCVPQKKHAV
mmetsp:Transcript_114156/g.254751  ORF Transcript_114156/g.254751 Transcript_114156/m.254751 type:complete len:251 (-) Transcript_114156:395-1147(-)